MGIGGDEERGRRHGSKLMRRDCNDSDGDNRHGFTQIDTNGLGNGQRSKNGGQLAMTRSFCLVPLPYSLSVLCALRGLGGESFPFGGGRLENALWRAIMGLHTIRNVRSGTVL